MEHYSKEFKEAAVKKILQKGGRTLQELGDEIGVSTNTLRTWRRQFSSGNMDIRKSPKQWTNSEKYKALMESKSISEDEMGKWLRGKGLRSEHLTLWEREISEAMSKDNVKGKKELEGLKRENKELKKELQKKDKALAEVSALLILKKKADLLWGERKES